MKTFTVELTLSIDAMSEDSAENKLDAFLSALDLKKNDKVVTAGGILGTVVNHRSDAEYVTLRVDEASNSKMQILAKSIVRVVSDEDGTDS